MKKHTTLKSKFNSAFSLVELLVVIAVIAVIAAIAIPNITGIREGATAARAQADAGTVLRVYQAAVQAQATNAAGDAVIGWTDILEGVGSTIAGQPVTFKADVTTDVTTISNRLNFTNLDLVVTDTNTGTTTTNPVLAPVSLKE
jgi:prepilin-type N-terminal cleavage/methylation domain-containing protein